MWSDDLIVSIIVLGVVAFYAYFIVQIRKQWIQLTERQPVSRHGAARSPKNGLVFYSIVIIGFSLLVLPAVIDIVRLEIVRHR